MRFYLSTRARFGLALGCSSIVSLLLFGVSVIRDHSFSFWYLVYNLCLAWVPLVLTMWIVRMLRTHVWSSWSTFIVTLFWLGFLPNTFYMISDYIHLQQVPTDDLLFDVVMFSSFILNAFVLGLVSLYVIHAELRKRMTVAGSWCMFAAITFLTSYAIYLGRDLRWNTWDVLLNPASILFDVSDGLLHPATHPDMFTTTFGFSLLIASLYIVVWYALKAARQLKLPE